jgi:hypothetical protein
MKSTFFLKEPIPSGVAISELSIGVKKPTSKSRETIPLSMCFIRNDSELLLVQYFLDNSQFDSLQRRYDDLGSLAFLSQRVRVL